MSIIVIVSICAAIAALIGLRVYIEHKQEDDKQLENIGKEEEAFYNLQAFVINPQESTALPSTVEEKSENQPKVDTPNPTFVDVENVNSAAALAENKPKKKKRYYGNRKPQAKKNQNKQTKK